MIQLIERFSIHTVKHGEEQFFLLYKAETNRKLSFVRSFRRGMLTGAFIKNEWNYIMNTLLTAEEVGQLMGGN
jgi:hypothetical protein